MTTTDFTKLAASAKNAEELPKANRGRTAQPNPFTDLVWESYETEQAKTLPGLSDDEALIKRTQSFIRRAAQEHGVGCSIRVTEGSKAGTVDVTFLARDKRGYSNGDE